MFDFCENDYNSTGNSHFWAWSNFNIFANFGLLMTNNGALALSHQGKFVFCHLTWGRHNHRNINLAQNKQTVAYFGAKLGFLATF